MDNNPLDTQNSQVLGNITIVGTFTKKVGENPENAKCNPRPNASSPMQQHCTCMHCNKRAYQRQITLRIVGYYFSYWLTATLNLCLIYHKLLEDSSNIMASAHVILK